MNYFDSTSLYTYSLHLTFVIDVILLSLSAWYTYRLHLYKIRYIWFLFIDSYSTKGVRFFDVVRQMNELNTVSKTPEYLKNVEDSLGSTSVNTIENKIISLMLDKVSYQYTFGMNRSVEKSLLFSILFSGDRVALGETSKYATLISKYLLYKLVRKIEYKEEQYVNPELYDSLTK